VRRSVYCTASFSVCSLRRAKFPIIYPDLRFNYKVATHPGGFMLLLLDVARANFRVNPYLHGSARWAGLSDIKAAGLLGNDGVYVGAWRDKGVKFTISDTLVPSTFSVTLRRGAGRVLALLCRLCSPGSKACS
jgi:hypothetical protein